MGGRASGSDVDKKARDLVEAAISVIISVHFNDDPAVVLSSDDVWSASAHLDEGGYCYHGFPDVYDNLMGGVKNLTPPSLHEVQTESTTMKSWWGSALVTTAMFPFAHHWSKLNASRVQTIVGIGPGHPQYFDFRINLLRGTATQAATISKVDGKLGADSFVFEIHWDAQFKHAKLQWVYDDRLEEAARAAAAAEGKAKWENRIKGCITCCAINSKANDRTTLTLSGCVQCRQRGSIASDLMYESLGFKIGEEVEVEYDEVEWVRGKVSQYNPKEHTWTVTHDQWDEEHRIQKGIEKGEMYKLE